MIVGKLLPSGELEPLDKDSVCLTLTGGGSLREIDLATRTAVSIVRTDEFVGTR